MIARPLPSSAPAAQGVDATGVEAFLDALDAAPGIRPHSLLILRHGHLVAAGSWAPYTQDRPHLLYSLSKSFTGTAAGLAAAEGLLRLDDPVLAYFPEFADEVTDPRVRGMLLRHVASMASGHVAETMDRARALDPDDLLHGFLRLPPERDPGTVFAYNQPATYTLAAVVQRVTGQSLTDYLRPRLFDPLGIGGAVWHRDRGGRELGFSGLHATCDAVARLGQLYLDRGRWEGRQLLPEEWVAEATRPHIATAGAMSGGDWDLGYGLQFWMSRHGFRGDGAYGQFCLVLPEQDAVVALTSETVGMQTVLDLVWAHLLPAFHPGPLGGREGADAALRERLAHLTLPAAAGKPTPPERADAWAGAVFAPEGGGCADQPGLTSVSVTAEEDGWTLTLTEDGHALPLHLGDGGWAVAEEPLPTAVSGGWTDAGTLAVDVAFLETPHSLCVTCSLPGRTFTARWHTTPLMPGVPLRKLRAPGSSS
ncbi:serine hydrolase [Streptomyces sp. NPDC049915]|uniref:serine hydrolase domain-containing protein n=1 Tax=Streptomyces sp. NPDC049915 TaxID=3155510 RepID=UPI003429119E